MSMAEYLRDKGLYEDYLEWRKLTPQERELEKLRYTNPTVYKSQKLYLQRQKEGRYDSCMIGYVGELPVKYDFNSKSMKFINPNRIGHPLENSTNRLTIENNLFMFVRRNFNLSLEGATYLVSIFTRRTAVNYIIDMLDDLIYYESEKISPLYVILKRYYDNMKYFLNNIKIKEISV